jgi:hypothetical protein
MATPLSAIVTIARDRLNEPVPRFWSNAELLRYGNRGIRDMHRQIGATHQNYFHEISVAVTHAVDATQLSDVPSNVTVVHGLEPADLQTNPHLYYKRCDYNHPDFQAARSIPARDPSSGLTVYYAITQAGGPVAAPVILVAPKINAARLLRLTFMPTVGAELVATDPNPIPGESDNALVHWIVAYARGRQLKLQGPDEKELGLYQRELDRIMQAITPRDDSEPEVVEPMFKEYW